MAKKLYVGNLSFNTAEADLESLFGEFGEVHSVKIIVDRYTGNSRGFAFVEMENADKAMEELNGKTVEDRPLTVNEAREKPKRDSSGGGGYGGGGNRGGRGDRW